MKLRGAVTTDEMDHWNLSTFFGACRQDLAWHIDLVGWVNEVLHSRHPF